MSEIRAPNKEDIRKEFESTSANLKQLADKYAINYGTLKSWKSREDWKKEPSVAKPDKPKKPSGAPRGNKNAQGHGAPKGNKNNLKHGFFSKFLPQNPEFMEIMKAAEKMDPIEMIWSTIVLKYSQIIWMQKIMFVEDKDDMTKEIKKKKTFMTEDMESEEIEYEIQFAWDKQSGYINAMARAMGELRTAIRQFLNAAPENDKRRLELETMRLDIDKKKAELSKIQSDSKGSADDWTQAVQEIAERRRAQVNGHE